MQEQGGASRSEGRTARSVNPLPWRVGRVGRRGASSSLRGQAVCHRGTPHSTPRHALLSNLQTLCFPHIAHLISSMHVHACRRPPLRRATEQVRSPSSGHVASLRPRLQMSSMTDTACVGVSSCASFQLSLAAVVTGSQSLALVRATDPYLTGHQVGKFHRTLSASAAGQLMPPAVADHGHFHFPGGGQGDLPVGSLSWQSDNFTVMYCLGGHTAGHVCRSVHEMARN